MADSATIARFHAERQALAMMDHPDIARVYEADATSTGQPYLAMEYCEGLPLDQYCNQRQLNLTARIELLVRVARAVSRAHAHGVIHRDLKPSNVLVADCEGRPNLKIIDFGIAKFIDEQFAPDASHATRIGEMVGTPAYMSPEQAAGPKIDGRTDVFAIGAMLFKLLTGTTPLQLPVAGPTSLAQILALLQAFQPGTPTRRFATYDAQTKLRVARQLGATPAQWIRRLRGDLDWITLRAIEPDRVRRYATADDLADDLERFLRNEPVVAVAPSRSYRIKKFYQRRRSFVWAVASVTATFMIASVVSGVAWWSYEAEKSQEERQIVSEVQFLLDEADAARNRGTWGGRTSTAEFLAAQQDLARAAELLANRPEQRELHEQLAKSVSRVGTDQAALQLASQLTEARESVTQRNIAETGKALGRQAGLEQLSLAFQNFGIEPLASEPREAAAALQACPQSVGRQLIEALDFLLYEAPIECESKFGEAAAHWAFAVLTELDPHPWRMTLRRAMLTADVAELERLARSSELASQPPFTLVQLAGTLYLHKRTNEAVRFLEIAQRYHPQDFWANHYLGIALSTAHEPPLVEEGLRYLTSAVSLRPQSVGARLNLADSLLQQGAWQEALTHTQIAADLLPDNAPLQQRLSFLSDRLKTATLLGDDEGPNAREQGAMDADSLD
jgi:serine/threonine protein kinase